MALAKEPEARFQSAADAACVLAEVDKHAELRWWSLVRSASRPRAPPGRSWTSTSLGERHARTTPDPPSTPKTRLPSWKTGATSMTPWPPSR